MKDSQEWFTNILTCPGELNDLGREHVISCLLWQAWPPLGDSQHLMNYKWFILDWLKFSNAPLMDKGDQGNKQWVLCTFHNLLSVGASLRPQTMPLRSSRAFCSRVHLTHFDAALRFSLYAWWCLYLLKLCKYKGDITIKPSKSNE